MKIKQIHTLHDIQLLHPSGLMIWQKENILSTAWAKIYQAIMRFLFVSPEIVISPSQWLLDEHVQRGFFQNSKTAVLSNCFTQEIKVDESKIKNSNSKFCFLYVGQVEAHKGVEFLVAVFLKFLGNHPQAELSIAGPGSLIDMVKKAAGGRKEIKILGRKNESEVEELMLSADCLVVPSLCYETSPTVIYEAASVRLPVLASGIGGIPELIAAVGGVLFEPGNGDDLAKKMEEIMIFPEKTEQIRAREGLYRKADYISELVSLASSVKNV